VKDARVDYQGLKSHSTIQTWREYWQDAQHTVAVWNLNMATISLNDIETAIQKPFYTPVLGRRSCPVTRPLFECRRSAENAIDALRSIAPFSGTIYSDEDSEGAIKLKKRDIPIIHQPRQFASRTVYMCKGGSHVSE
jgi:CRISPR system Cascade subunit CasD